MRIYIAGSSDELDRASKWIEMLRVSGLDVTHDWPAMVRDVGEGNPKGATSEDRRGWATSCVEAVRDANLLWLLMPIKTSFGAFSELGIAIERQTPIVVSGPLLHRSIFTDLADRVYADDQMAFACVSGWSRNHPPPGDLAG